MMRPDNPNGKARAQVGVETVHQSIDDLRKSLTVIFAYAQFLQRQGRRGDPLPRAEVEKRAQVIADAAMDMIDDLKKLEDACDE